MKCVNHPEVDATGTCVECNRGICAKCKRELAGKAYCRICADDLIHKTNEALSLAKMKGGRTNINAVGSNVRSLRWRPIFLAALFICISIPVAIGVFIYCGPNISITALNFTLLGITLVCYMIGGLLAGAIVGYRGALHGMTAALIACFIVIGFTVLAIRHAEFDDGWIILTLTIELLIIPVFGALGGFLGERLFNR